MNRLFVFLIFVMFWNDASSQYQDYIGAGHSNGVSINTSDDFSAPNIWPQSTAGINTINGKGLNFEEHQAGRLLEQTSICYEKRHIDDVVSMGVEPWIDNQFNEIPSYLLPTTIAIHNAYNDSILLENGGDSTQLSISPGWQFFNYAFWDTNMTNEDLLRHNVAYALAQILVVSRNGELSTHGTGLASYYDVLMEHAFGNFEDLLYDITLSPTMGVFLTHLNNPKTDLTENIRPDENFAREIMQLFSIGLYELNLDGSRKIDSNGDWIPTYGQVDVKELAKVFTGLSFGDAVSPSWGNFEPQFGLLHWYGDYTVPMIMYDSDDPTTPFIDEDQHEDGNKILFGNQIVEANASGLAEIADAINIIFNHPNVGPFISYRLIQRMIKSNPSPAYVARVASIFNDNGNGVRGDMQAVVKAILMDEEARDCSYQDDSHNGRLKEPFQRLLHFMRTIPKITPNGQYLNTTDQFYFNVNQDILSAPSVFNYWLPTHTPFGPISDAELVAPEFQLHSSKTSVAYMNYMDDMIGYGHIMNSQVFANDLVFWDKDEHYPYIEDPELYLNWLDMRFTHGQLSDESRRLFRNALLEIGSVQHPDYYQQWRTQSGMYFMLISPDFGITR